MSRGAAWSVGALDLLRAMWPTQSALAIGRRVGRSHAAVKSMAARLHLRKREDVRRSWTVKDDEALRRLYPFLGTREVAAALRRPVTAVSARAKKLGVEKSAERMAAVCQASAQMLQERGAAFRFKKGQTSHNKGQRGYSPPGCEKGWFTKGARNGKAAQLWMPIGSERLIDGFLYVKVAEVPNVAYTVNWKAVHVLLWEQKNGPVPKGHCLRFVDGDRSNITLENLRLTSRVELMRRNTVHNLPPEVAEVVLLRAALVRRINKRRERDEKQD